ncbi:efflux RND transporter permease subunit [Pectinatus frisingensis]|uniref:efflux RND transporter permease subunit n=1 Tax=Pectinatus frisingensis TaxID=865 RepID=UPI0015F59EA8|nr:efflux RND transporter permease subunit [Pectinatus frisingensis]
MNITRYCIKKPIGISMIVLFFVVLGLFSFYKIGVELLPAINIPYVTVTVNYPGADSEEIEQDVIKPLENSLSSLTNLKHMTAVARPEKAQITLEFQFWTNIDTAAIDTSQYVNAVLNKLPNGIQTPTVLKRDVDALPILEISVLSNKPLGDVYTVANDTFVERLQRAGGVSDVQIGGGRDKEVAVNVDKDKLAYFGLSLSQIVSRIEQENILTPAGSVYGPQSETNVRLTAQYKSPEELASIHINNSKGTAIPLSSIADVQEQDQRVTRYARTDGQDTVSLSVYKNSDANLVDTTKAVMAQLELLRKDYPDYQFVVITNSSTYVEDALHNTLEALIEGLFTTGLVLFLFLRGWRSTVAVLIAIPTSLITTFFMMYTAGFTFNMLSLMGMSLCVGILVDDSIVVLENINRHLRRGKPADQAAEDGRNEIGTAAIAITLCDVVVFMPIAFMNGMTGQFFRQFGLTIVFATLCSLAVSFTLTPMLASRFYKNGLGNPPKGKLWDFFDSVGDKTLVYYEKLLHWSFFHTKKITMSVAIMLLAAISLYYPLGIIGGEYMPKTDEGSFRIMMQFPVGQNIDATNDKVRQVEEYLMQQPEIKTYLSSVGQPAGNYGSVSVQLIDKSKRENIWQFTDKVRGYLRKQFPEASVQVNPSASSMPGVSGGTGTGNSAGNTAPVQIEISGNDLKNTVAASYKVQDILNQTDGLKDVRSSYTEGAPELRLVVDRERLRYFNTTANNIQNVFSGAIAGSLAGYMMNDPNNDNQDTDIYVRLKGSDGFKVSDIRSIPVSTNTGLIRLEDVADIKYDAGPVMLRRVDKREAINISANIDDGRSLQDMIAKISQNLSKENLGDNVTYRFTGQADNMHDTFTEMGQAIALSLLLVYILLAVLYESLSTPVIRMLSLPFGLIGAFAFLALTRNTINLYSLLGILVMDGLVAKNGTLLLDYTLTLMHRGKDAKVAVVEAAKTRIKPIFMTSITMVTGMLPTALAVTPGSESRVSMAWVVIGGLLSSTFFTLIVIPLVFVYFAQTKFSLKNMLAPIRKIAGIWRH